MQYFVYDTAMFRMAFMGILLTILLFPKLAASAELVLVEQQGCEWCEVWNEEIAPVYARTPEGRVAPLRRVDIHDPLPEDLKFIRGLAFTPTFVLVDQGKEVGRILGYPGEDFFWGLLQELIAKLPGFKNQPPHLDRVHQGGPAAARG